MENLMKMMTIIVWGLYDENSRSYELKKKSNFEEKKSIIIFFNQIFSTDLSQVGRGGEETYPTRNRSM